MAPRRSSDHAAAVDRRPPARRRWRRKTPLRPWHRVHGNAKTIARPAGPATQIHGNKYWEFSWTLIPLVIIAGLIVVTVRTQSTVLHQQPDPDLTVEVTGFQWSWRFAYPESGAEVVGSSRRPPELVVPALHP
jgi:heme/copper-type cytochrome/quinol oxidase subunit 2